MLNTFLPLFQDTNKKVEKLISTYFFYEGRIYAYKTYYGHLFYIFSFLLTFNLCLSISMKVQIILCHFWANPKNTLKIKRESDRLSYIIMRGKLLY